MFNWASGPQCESRNGSTTVHSCLLPIIALITNKGLQDNRREEIPFVLTIKECRQVEMD